MHRCRARATPRPAPPLLPSSSTCSRCLRPSRSLGRRAQAFTPRSWTVGRRLSGRRRSVRQAELATSAPQVDRLNTVRAMRRHRAGGSDDEPEAREVVGRLGEHDHADCESPPRFTTRVAHGNALGGIQVDAANRRSVPATAPPPRDPRPAGRHSCPELGGPSGADAGSPVNVDRRAGCRARRGARGRVLRPRRGCVAPSRRPCRWGLRAPSRASPSR